MDSTKWKRRAAAAEHIGVSPKTLANWATMGIGPAYQSRGRGAHVVYEVAELDRWLREQARTDLATAAVSRARKRIDYARRELAEAEQLLEVVDDERLNMPAGGDPDGSAEGAGDSEDRSAT